MNKDNFKKVSHVSYSKCYVTLYEEESTGIQCEVTVKRLQGGFGLGKSKRVYLVKGRDVVYKTYDAALAATKPQTINSKP